MIRCFIAVEPANLHLTLKFLGEIDEAQAEILKQKVGSAVRGLGEFSIQSDHRAGSIKHSARRAHQEAAGDSIPVRNTRTGFKNRLLPIHSLAQGTKSTLPLPKYHSSVKSRLACYTYTGGKRLRPISSRRVVESAT